MAKKLVTRSEQVGIDRKILIVAPVWIIAIPMYLPQALFAQNIREARLQHGFSNVGYVLPKGSKLDLRGRFTTFKPKYVGGFFFLLFFSLLSLYNVQEIEGGKLNLEIVYCRYYIYTHVI